MEITLGTKVGFGPIKPNIVELGSRRAFLSYIMALIGAKSLSGSFETAEPHK